MLYALFYSCDKNGRFIFEIAPNLFGPELTVQEMEYWSVFRSMQAAINFDIDYTCLTWDELQKDLNLAYIKYKERIKNVGRGGTKKGSPR